MKSNLDWKIEESKRVIDYALNKWKHNCGIAFTGRKDSTVLVSLIRRETSEIPKVMFIDHGKHFPESISHINKVVKLWHLNIEWIKDERIIRKIKYSKGETTQDLMNNYKIEMIRKAVTENGWGALFTAIRWDEHPARKQEMYFSQRSDHVRVHPLLHWTEEDIWRYIRENDIPYNPMYDMGYRSLEEIGTEKVKFIRESERSGRKGDKEQIMER